MCVYSFGYALVDQTNYMMILKYSRTIMTTSNDVCFKFLCKTHHHESLFYIERVISSGTGVQQLVQFRGTHRVEVALTLVVS